MSTTILATVLAATFLTHQVPDDTLVRHLNDQHFSCREWAEGELARRLKVGPHVPPFSPPGWAAAAVNSIDPEVRFRAARVLQGDRPAQRKAARAAMFQRYKTYPHCDACFYVFHDRDGRIDDKYFDPVVAVLKAYPYYNKERYYAMLVRENSIRPPPGSEMELWAWDQWAALELGVEMLEAGYGFKDVDAVYDVLWLQTVRWVLTMHPAKIPPAVIKKYGVRAVLLNRRLEDWVILPFGR